MKTLQHTKNLLFVILFGLLITSCSKEDVLETNELTSVSVKLSSTSVLYNAVYLDVKDIMIQTGKNAQNDNSWVSLGTLNPGVHNFTEMNNDAELILVEDLVIPASHVYKVKLVLGDDNAMVMDNVLYAIDTPSTNNKESVNVVDRSLDANKSYEFTLQFELDSSIDVDGMDVVLNPKMNTEMRLYEFH